MRGVDARDLTPLPPMCFLRQSSVCQKAVTQPLAVRDTSGLPARLGCHGSARGF